MKRYNLLNKDDLIKGETYECISLFGDNPNPRSENIIYDFNGKWVGIAENHTVLVLIDNSVMLKLAQNNFERYQEVVLGGSYDDGKFNDEGCKSCFPDCEELYPVVKDNVDMEREL